MKDFLYLNTEYGVLFVAMDYRSSLLLSPWGCIVCNWCIHWCIRMLHPVRLVPVEAVVLVTSLGFEGNAACL